jgi:hypothetical protein
VPEPPRSHAEQREKVRIDFEAAPPIDDPTPEQVDQGLRALRFPDDTFAVLELRPSTYIQTATEDDGSFVVEYRDGSSDKHFRAARPMRLDDVIAAFQSYLRQDDQWRSRFEWERLDLESGDAPPAPPGQRPTAGRGRRRGRPVAARRGDDRAWLSGGCLTVFYAVLVPLAVVLTVVLLRAGVQGGLASTGLAGEPGQVVVSACHPTRYAAGCSGIFTPSDRALALPSIVAVEGWYSSGDAVDVHLLGGDAWPEGGATAGLWIVPLLFGGAFLVAGALGVLDVARRGWRRLRAARVPEEGDNRRVSRRR